MKPSSVLLGTSLTVNAALASVFFFWSPEPLSSAAPTSSAAEETTHPPAKTRPASETPAMARAWDKLRSGDLPSLVTRLRAAGFPPRMVSAIVREMVDEEFARRRRALSAAHEKPFWQGRTDSGYNPAVQHELHKLDREQEKLLLALLGPDDPITADLNHSSMLLQFGRELSPEKFARVRAIQEDFSDRIQQIAAKSQGGPYLPEDINRIRELQSSLHDELAKTLSPEELFEHDLRTLAVGYQARRDLAAVDATEAEYRALFPLYQALETQYPLKPGASTEAELAPRRAAERQMEEQIKSLLGPERFAAYQLGKYYEFQQTLKVTERLKLPAATAVQLYTLQQDMDQRARALGAGGALTPAERTGQLAALATEAKTKIRAVLGEPGLAAYQQYSGQWLTRLESTPRPAGKGR